MKKLHEIAKGIASFRSEMTGLFSAFSCLLNVLLLRIVSIFWNVRLLYIEGHVIGHIVHHTETFACEVERGKYKIGRFDIVLVCLVAESDKVVCNEQLALMARRYFKTLGYFVWFPSKEYFHRLLSFNRRFPGWERNELIPGISLRGESEPTSQYPSHFILNKEEEQRGLAELRKMGIGEKDRYVCVLVRDALFRGDPDNMRNSHVNDFNETMLALAERGFYVIRMGARVSQKLTINHPKIIDYATNGMRSELLDVYLAAHCHFSLSTPSGWDELPFIFKRPFVYVSLADVWIIPAYAPNSLSITKKFKLSMTGEYLPISRLIQILMPQKGMAIRSIGFLASLGVEIIDNTPEEIKAATFEMVDRLDGTWKSSPKDEALQEYFWKQYYKVAHGPPHWMFKEPMPVNAHGGRALVGRDFLKNNIAWLQR